MPNDSPTNLYRAYGIAVLSTVALPELPHIDGEPVGAPFRFEAVSRLPPVSNPWFHHWRGPGGVILMSASREAAGYRLRFPGLAEFELRQQGRFIRGCPLGATARPMLRNLLLDQVLPLAMTLQGRLAMHASCVQTPAGAIAFLGSSGLGKSTLCAEFARRGFPVLCDDCLIVCPDRRGCRAVPSYPSLRLWPESLALLPRQRGIPLAPGRSKRRIDIGSDGTAFCDESVPLIRLYVLGAGSRDIRIRRLPFVRRFLTLVRHGFRLEIARPEQLRREFHALERLAATECRYLSYPRQLTRIGEVHSAILHDLGTQQR